MSTPNTTVNEIQDAIDTFTIGLPELDKKQYDKVYALLKDLSLDADGHIKPTIENLKVIARVKNQLGSFIDLPIYQNKIIELNSALDTIAKVQTDYMAKTFISFTMPKTVPKLQELAFSSTVDQLAGAGVQTEVVDISADLVEQHIRDGSSFSTLVDELKVQMVGNDKIPSRLISFSKGVINDTLSGFARNYNALVTDDLDLEYFVYVGSLVGTSRPMCEVLVAKEYIHKSELPGIARGIVDGNFVGTQGFMPSTTGANFIYRCAGWNCSHLCIPVPSSVVPKILRDKFEKA